MKVTIRSKLFMGFGVMLCCMAAIGGIGWWHTASLLADVQNLSNNNAQAAVQLGKVMEAAQTAQRMQMGVLGVAMILGMGVAWFIARNIANPMAKMTQAAARLAVGDINQTITHQSRDETGALAQSFRECIAYLKERAAMVEALSQGDLTVQVHAQSDQDVLSQSFMRMTERLHRSFREMVENATALNSAASELAAASQQVSSSASDMNGKATTAATSAKEMSDNMGVVAAGTEEMTATIGEVAQNAEKARQIVAQAVRSATAASHQVGELSTAAREISQVTEAIIEVAEQTKLLALNATIEAARAGEAGKGFAVVANEVKALAQQTNTATEDIRLKIDAIQQSTMRAVHEIEQISAVITDVNESVASIAAAVEEQAVTTKDIAGTVGRAAIVSQEITTGMVTVSSTGAEMEATSVQLKDQAVALTRMGQALQEAVGQFRW